MYCSKCKKVTESVYNDWMVEFCAVCHSRRPYMWTPQPFQCIHCGYMLDQTYPGQTVCKSCEASLKGNHE